MEKQRALAAARARAQAALEAERSRAQTAEATAAVKRLEDAQRAEDARVLAQAVKEAVRQPQLPSLIFNLPSEIRASAMPTETIAERDPDGLLIRSVTRPLREEDPD